MPDDSNVIFLEQHRNARKEPAPEPAPEPAREAGSGERTPAAPLPGKLIWLHCPVCKTLEYTEFSVPGGRVHNVCGTMVEEAALDVDLRAEYTIAELNLERLKMLSDLMAGQRNRFQEYQRRLRKLAGGKLSGYPNRDAIVKSLPVAGLDALGLFIPTALHEPDRHFAKPAAGKDGGETSDGETPDGPPPTPPAAG